MKGAGEQVEKRYRRAERHKWEVEISVRRRGDPAVGTTMTDLSRTGFRLRTYQILKPEMELWIKLPGLEALKARVCWVRDFEAGCAFEDPLYEPVFHHLVRSVQSSR